MDTDMYLLKPFDNLSLDFELFIPKKIEMKWTHQFDFNISKGNGFKIAARIF